jgi:Leucine-rich repeat (LRR) protein
LRILFLYDAKLTEFPSVIFAMTRLSVLDLHGNQISVIPPQIATMKSLERLALYSNKLTRLPYELHELEALDKLLVDDNPLEFPPEKIVSQPASAIRRFLKEEHEVQKYAVKVGVAAAAPAPKATSPAARR